MLKRPLVPYLITTVGALLAGTVMHVLWPDWRWHHEPLHSTIEALGGLVAIAMATVLVRGHGEAAAGRYHSLAAGFLGMGLLEEFHAISRTGNGFVLFRNLASLAGGIGFVLACRSYPPQPGSSRPRWHPWMITIAALSIGTWFLIFPQHIPEMVRNGQFTPTAVAPQSIACLLFLIGAARFLMEYRSSNRSEDALFASLALLFALAEFVFMYSVPWDNRWWFWHSLRLAASLLALGYVGRSYIQARSDLEASLAQTIRAKETLSHSEGRLRQVLDERTRMAENLHDSTIQSLFAIGLNLERCQRLVSDSHREAGLQLGAAVGSLKAVIRDLRGYILGSESPITNGRALEAALTSLVDEMNGLHQLHFHLHTGSGAVERVGAEQAVHILSIAREAMSNSLRHSAARMGTLSLEAHDGYVRLSVEDDGIGFDAGNRRRGQGLSNMEARAKRLGGRLEVVSDPGHGTRIVFDLPQEQGHAAT
ncbi:MAG TPA: ATP-binding protein [Nitrospira sp.]|nr:ATP-binding protein [Nitrospira sp.]